jgi:hypothetical protein
MLPAAPARLSITNCWPMLSDTFCSTMRPTTSFEPPAGHGITTRTGLVGYPAPAGVAAVCANAGAADAPATIRIAWINDRCMLPLLVIIGEIGTRLSAIAAAGSTPSRIAGALTSR